MRIFSTNPRAQYYTTWYVDGFASGGYRAIPSKKVTDTGLFPELAEPETQAFVEGSARKALEVEPSFDRYLFVDLDPERCKELETLRTLYPKLASAIQIENREANDYLKLWCATTDWSRARAVMFLDPFGTQIEWSLLQSIAQTRAIDLWLLFPLGAAINRMLTRNAPPPSGWADILTRVLGTDTWKTEFYPEKREQTLFGEEETQAKEADWKRIETHFVRRLETIFPGVAHNPLPLRNSRNVPLYLLYFAAGNPKGAKTAIKIAQDILKR